MIHESWREVLAPHSQSVREILRHCEPDTWPQRSDVFRALAVPRQAVRVVIVGQDPYPTPGHAHGLAFSVPDSVSPLPRSLNNIFRELEDDLGVRRTAGDLSDWVSQGVLLLNRVLTVRAGQAGSHRGRGWEAFTESVLRAVQPQAVVLWGNDAQTARGFFGAVPIIASAHPSPLSAHRGFFGSRPFSRINAALTVANGRPLEWARRIP
jgi:uracil-DNA glycosylase